jgi:phage baseplate assembly protein gpV
MKLFTSLNLLVILSLTLAACSPATPAVPAAGEAQPQAAVSGEATPAAGETQLPAAVSGEATPTPYAAAYLSTEYPDAASLRNQLAYGTLKFEGTEYAVTAEQANALLPLWQAIVALSGDEITASEELTAVQNQITEAMTPAQLEAIAALQITNADLNAFYAELGIVFPTPVPGVTKEPGSGKNISPEDKEATQAAAAALGTPVGTGSESSAGQAARTLLFDTVVELLIDRATQ